MNPRMPTILLSPISSDGFKDAISACNINSLTVALFYARNKDDKPRVKSIEQELIKRANDLKARNPNEI